MSGMVEALNRAAAGWWDWTVVSTGQGALLLLVVGAILFAGTFLRPGLRYGLLLVVLMKFAVPPVFGVAYGFSDLLARALTKDPAPTQSTTPPESVEVAVAPLTSPPTVPVVPIAPPAPALSRLAWLLLLEAAGVTIILALIARQWAAARGLVKRSAQGDSALQERFQATVRAMTLRRRPRLCLSEEARAPQSGGIFRPFVVLPTWAATMPEEELDILLAHELAHVRRMDALVNSLQAAAQALLWWNPAVWWLNRRIREEREFCCDDLVLARGIASGAAYSRTLVNVAERVSLAQSSWAMAGMADNFGAIDRRVRRALQGGQTRRGWGHHGALLTILMVAGWVLPGATDGDEKGFDAIEAAKVESAYRIHEIQSDQVGRDENGVPMRSGKISFTLRSSAPNMPGLEVTATGQFLYPGATETSEKCVLAGEIKATYRETAIKASRIEFGNDGVVDFGRATLDTGQIKALTSASMVLDLRDGTLAMQDGKADEVNTDGGSATPDIPTFDVHKFSSSSVTSTGSSPKVTVFDNVRFSLIGAVGSPEVSLQAKRLEHTTGKDVNTVILEGEVAASFSEFTVKARRLELLPAFKFYDVVLDSIAFGVINAEQVRVDPVARQLGILNGTVDEARLKAALGEDAKNAPRGEWLSLPFTVEPIFKVSATIVEIDRNADFTLPSGVKLAEYLIEGSPHGIGIVDGEEWLRFEQSIQKEIEDGHAKRLSSPSLIAPGGEDATITVGEAVATDAVAEVSDRELGVSLSAVATMHQADEGVTGILLDLEYTHAEAGAPVDGKSVVNKITSQSTVLLPKEGSWCYQVVLRSGERVDLLCVSAALVKP